MIKEMIKPPFLWGIVSGAVALLIIIFWTGWVVTSSTAEAEGKQMAKEAVLENLVPICVESSNIGAAKIAKKIEGIKNLDNKKCILWFDGTKFCVFK